MSKERLILIIGVGCALVAVLFLAGYIKQFEKGKEEEIKKKLAAMNEAKQANVLVATKDIPKGSKVDQDSIEVKKVSREYLQPGAVSSLDRIADMMVIAPIYQGEQVTLSKLSRPRRAGDLAEVTPVGKRAVTIVADNLGSLVGMVRPGDYVDIVALIGVPTQTADKKTVAQLAVVPVFQNVLVLAVGRSVESAPAPAATAKGGQRYEGGSAPGGGIKKDEAAFITIALTPQEANLIAFIQEQGRLRLVLRSTADANVQPTQPANWDTFFTHVMPWLKAKEEEKPESFIEVYRGLNKENVPVYRGR